MVARRKLMAAWLSVGILPLLLQGRSYLRFVTPHKLTEDLVVPVGAATETANIAELCPVEGLFIAHVWWNVALTHYYSVEHGQICHFVVPQYNIHGSFKLGTEKVAPFSTAPASCANESYVFEHYFYHGSIGYYSFYEEAVGTYCTNDKTAYVRVRGLGTLDSNGAALARDRGNVGYRCSYWYGTFGSIWIIYRGMLLRKSYVLCKQYGRKCDRMNEQLRRKAAVVYMQESMRLSADGTTNYHRIAILYMLLEGLMSDLFLLIAQDGLLSRIQYVSLGYNLSGVLSMLFELFESIHWLREKTRLVLKRLIFCYETSLIGEFLSAGLMQHYLTWINQSDLRHSRPTALAVSYYVWSLIGHGVIVLGLTAFVISVRITWTTIYTRWHHGTLKVLTAPCCVDTTLGVRSKMIMLGGYCWEDDKLYYKTGALTSFGIMKTIEEDGAEYLVFRKVHWITVPRNDLYVIGNVSDDCVEPCRERLCTSPLTLFDHRLGGNLNRAGRSRPCIIRVDNKVAAGP
ncbi:hypothetical protein PHYPSEUDO_011915 [Phytophthora pseudosyringae]|uniref:Uncharacterized protein n=1 Tax=Phytophthora pseudosyringae TaxID=221518 RepID=A0A8T1W462_9STRA|nr:hypothetical protein PHYPSEUDO_011915 [Phytophthora pseudosyringae]